MKSTLLYCMCLPLAFAWGCGKPTAPAPRPVATATPPVLANQEEVLSATSENPPAIKPAEEDLVADSALSGLSLPQEEKPGEGNFASQIWRTTMTEALAQSEPGRKPRFEKEETKEGLRVTSNLNGRRYCYVLPGTDVEAGKPEWNAWLVGKRLVIVQFDTLRDLKAGSDLESLGKFRDVLVDDFKEKGLGLAAGTLQQLNLPGDEPGVVFELEVIDREALPQKEIAGFAMAATARGDSVVFFSSPVTEGQDRAEAARQLHDILTHSFQWLPDLPSAEAPLTAEDILKRGLTLAQLLRLRKIASMEDHSAWVNASLASRRDQKAEGATTLQPEELMRRLKTAVSTQPEFELSMQVFDGQSAHGLNLLRFDPVQKRFYYWEPWPADKGSFLQDGKNRAGIKAEADLSQPKSYSVTEEELQRILYFVVLPTTLHDKLQEAQKSP